jgi:hypothetical protein
MIEEGLVVGAHVRHTKQPAWGIGVVVSCARSATAVDVVVDFEAAGPKKLRLTQDVFARVTDDELAERAAAAAAAERAQKAAKKKAQPSQAKLQTLTPSHVVRGRFSTAAVVGGHVVVVGDGGAVHRYDSNANGGVIGGAPNCWPELWGRVDDVLLGHDRHGTHGWVLVHHNTGRARSWKPPRDVALPRTRSAAGGRLLLWGQRSLFVVDASGAVVSDVALPFLTATQHLVEVYAHGDGFAAEVFDKNNATEGFHVVGFGKDGVERWRHVGYRSGAAQGLVLLVQGRTCISVDAAGAIVARVDDVVPSGGFDHEDGFVADGSDVVCTVSGASGDAEVVRFDPATGAVRLRVPLPHAHQPPVLAGRTAAIAAHLYGDHAKDVRFVDVDDGRVIAEGSGAAGVSRCVAVDNGAFALESFAKKLVVWRKLHTATPEKLTLPHDDAVIGVVAPAPGVVVSSTAEGLFFWRI